MTTITDPDFQGSALLASASAPERLHVVKFTASWCRPCKAYAPILAAVADSHPDVAFLEADVEECGAAADALSVSSVPTVVFFKGGAELERVPGVLPLELLERFVQKHQAAPSA